MYVLFACDDLLLFDTCFLTCELAQIVKFSATYLTMLVHLDAVDVR